MVCLLIYLSHRLKIRISISLPRLRPWMEFRLPKTPSASFVCTIAAKSIMKPPYLPSKGCTNNHISDIKNRGMSFFYILTAGFR